MMKASLRCIFTAVSLLTAVFTASLFLTACQNFGAASSASSARSLSPMQVKAAVSDEQERESLPPSDTSFVHPYQYRMDENLKEIYFCIEEFRDGVLTCLAETGGIGDREGNFSVTVGPDGFTFGRNDERYTAHIKILPPGQLSITSWAEDLPSSPITANRLSIRQPYPKPEKSSRSM